MASTGSLPSLAPELLIEVIGFALGSTEDEFCTIGLDAILRLPKFNNLEKVLLQNSEPDTLQGNIVPSVDVEGPIYGSSGTINEGENSDKQKPTFFTVAKVLRL
jgi:hypothetical protein